MNLIQKLISFARKKGFGGKEIRYVIIGGLTSLINFVMFALMQIVFGIRESAAISASVSIPLLFANIISISTSILFAYITNKLIVFRRHCDTKVELALEIVKFVGSRLLTMALEIVSVQLLVDILGMNAIAGKAIAQIAVIIINYILSRLVVFRSTE